MDRAIFIGRDEDVALLREILDAADGPTLVEVAGEPGIGKTRLLAEYQRLGAAAGWAVALAVADELGDDLACDLMLQLRRQLMGDTAAGYGRHEMYRAVRDAVADAAAGAPGVLVLLDDVHWADAGSLSTLGRLMRDPPAAPVVFVLAYRGRQVGRGLAGVLRGARGLRRERVDLGGITAAQIGRLLATDNPAVAEAIHARCGGNPLYALALADTPVDAGDEPVEPGAIRADVARALLAETASLDAAGWAALQAAAVLGDRFDPVVLAAVLGCPPPLDCLVERDLLRADTVDESLYMFRHPVLRTVIYRSIRPVSRADLHAGAALAMRRLGLPPARYAGHLARGCRPGDTAAARTLLRAALDVSATAPASAAAWLREAARVAPDEPDLRCDIELARAAAHIGSGRLGDGRKVLERLDSRDAPTAQRVRHAVARAAIHRLLGQPAAAMAIVQAAAGAAKGAEAVALHLEGAVCATLCGDPRYLELLDRAARELPDSADDLRHTHDIVSVFAATYFGSTPATAARLSAAASALDASPDREIAAALSPFGLLAWAELLLERDAAALSHFDRALAVAEASGQVHLVPYLLIGRSFGLSRLGRLGEALSVAADAAETARALGVPSLIGLVGSFRAAQIAWQQGPDAGWVVARSAVDLVAPVGRDWFAEIARRGATKLRHQAGRAVNGVSALQAVCGGPDLPWLDAATRPFWLAHLAALHLGDGHVEAAAERVAQARCDAARSGLTGQAAHAEVAAATLAIARRDPATAVDLALGAAHDFERLTWLLDEGATRLVAAQALAAAGHTAEAWSQLARVREIAADTGAAALQHAAVNGQRSAGAHAPRPPHPPDTALTQREKRIAELVRDGCNNREIAAQLSVTTKTVEAHLTRIFRKAGVSSRTQLIAAGIADET